MLQNAYLYSPVGGPKNASLLFGAPKKSFVGIVRRARLEKIGRVPRREKSWTSMSIEGRRRKGGIKCHARIRFERKNRSFQQENPSRREGCRSVQRASEVRRRGETCPSFVASVAGASGASVHRGVTAQSCERYYACVLSE